MAKDAQTERVSLWTPVGIFSYPFFAAPDSGGQYSKDEYRTDLFIPKATFKEKGKAFQEAVLKVGKDAFGSKYSLKDDKWHSPFKDTDLDDSIEAERLKGCIMIRAKAGPSKKKNKPAIQPLLIGPRKNSEGRFEKLTQEEIEAIKGGDYGCLNVTVFPYEGSKTVTPGISLYLSGVQFVKTGDALGQGRAKLLESAEEHEVEVDEPGEEDAPSKDSSDEGDDAVF